jgi:hypothetical protein
MPKPPFANICPRFQWANLWMATTLRIFYLMVPSISRVASFLGACKYLK